MGKTQFYHTNILKLIALSTSEAVKFSYLFVVYMHDVMLFKFGMV